MTAIKELSTQFVSNYTKGGTKQTWLEDGYVAGANAVLDALSDYIDNLPLGTNGDERWHRVCLIADIHDKIIELKGE